MGGFGDAEADIGRDRSARGGRAHARAGLGGWPLDRGAIGCDLRQHRPARRTSAGRGSAVRRGGREPGRRLRARGVRGWPLARYSAPPQEARAAPAGRFDGGACRRTRAAGNARHG